MSAARPRSALRRLVAAAAASLRRVGMVAVVAAAATGCGQERSELGGSISTTTYPLAFTRVTIAASDSSLTITYLTADDAIPAKLVVNAPQQLKAGKPFSLSGSQFTSQVTLSRLMPDPANVFPPVVAGSIDLTEVSTKAGSKVAGTFLLYFVDDKSKGSANVDGGASLRGSFVEKVS